MSRRFAIIVLLAFSLGLLVVGCGGNVSTLKPTATSIEHATLQAMPPTDTPTLVPPTDTPTVTQTPTITNTPTATSTFTPTLTVTPSVTPSPDWAGTAQVQSTQMAIFVDATLTANPTATITPSPTLTPSPTTDVTATAEASQTQHAEFQAALAMTEAAYTQVPSQTPYPTHTTQPTYTALPSQTPYPTATAQPTYTTVPSRTPTPEPTRDVIGTADAYQTQRAETQAQIADAAAATVAAYTQVPSQTPYPTATAQPTYTAVPSYTPHPTFTPPPDLIATYEAEATVDAEIQADQMATDIAAAVAETLTAQPTATPSPTRTATPTVVPSPTQTATPSPLPPTATLTASPTWTASPTAIPPTAAITLEPSATGPTPDMFATATAAQMTPTLRPAQLTATQIVSDATATRAAQTAGLVTPTLTTNQLTATQIVFEATMTRVAIQTATVQAAPTLDPAEMTATQIISEATATRAAQQTREAQYTPTLTINDMTATQVVQNATLTAQPTVGLEATATAVIQQATATAQAQAMVSIPVLFDAPEGWSPPEQIDNNTWYLTDDTAEIFIYTGDAVYFEQEWDIAADETNLSAAASAVASNLGGVWGSFDTERQIVSILVGDGDTRGVVYVKRLDEGWVIVSANAPADAVDVYRSDVFDPLAESVEPLPEPEEVTPTWTPTPLPPTVTPTPTLAPVTFESYSNDDMGLAFDVPQGWEEERLGEEDGFVTDELIAMSAVAFLVSPDDLEADIVSAPAMIILRVTLRDPALDETLSLDTLLDLMAEGAAITPFDQANYPASRAVVENGDFLAAVYGLEFGPNDWGIVYLVVPPEDSILWWDEVVMIPLVRSLQVTGPIAIPSTPMPSPTVPTPDRDATATAIAFQNATAEAQYEQTLTATAPTPTPLPPTLSAADASETAAAEMVTPTPSAVPFVMTATQFSLDLTMTATHYVTPTPSLTRTSRPTATYAPSPTYTASPDFPGQATAIVSGATATAVALADAAFPVVFDVPDGWTRRILDTNRVYLTDETAEIFIYAGDADYFAQQWQIPISQTDLEAAALNVADGLDAEVDIVDDARQVASIRTDDGNVQGIVFLKSLADGWVIVSANAPTDELDAYQSDVFDPLVDSLEPAEMPPQPESGALPMVFEAYSNDQLGLRFDVPADWMEYTDETLTEPDMMAVFFLEDPADAEALDDIPSAPALAVLRASNWFGDAADARTPREFLSEIFSVDLADIRDFDAAEYPAARYVVEDIEAGQGVAYALQLGGDDWVLLLLAVPDELNVLLLDETVMIRVVRSIEVTGTLQLTVPE